ncbi:glycosyltransferase family protein [Aliarcobacter skirrowii]|uniref:Sugar transferase n=1 Tax=Aliarcobacter skirrowii TaxID=28200 RepID=A0AAW9DAT2_9BACT|nr:hypothetical protein [Aliarcobacter skirrowii]MDX4069418.1 hypothetical protein [Aliarcobacter skirrowii]
MNNLAPIGIITYSRIDHLKKTINSLKKNNLAKYSQLYIFLDAPRTGDEDKVDIVRKYIHTIKGFNEVHIIERELNNLVMNSRLGLKYLLDNYGKCIFMEDDNVVSERFLQYMNDALEFFKNDKSIFAINAYNIPTTMSNTTLSSSFFKSRLFNAWGYATWKDRGLLDVLQYYGQYTEIIKNKTLYQEIIKTYPLLIGVLKKIHDGVRDAGDSKLTFHLIKNNLYVIKPFISFVNNIGHDGSGVNCNISNRYNNNELNLNSIIFKENIKYDEKMDKFYNSIVSINSKSINSNSLFSNYFNQFYQQIKLIDGKILIYGNGTIGKTIRALIPDKIVYYVDIADKEHHPYTLKNIVFDKILISVLGREEEIKNYLVNELDIDESMIITFNIL